MHRNRERPARRLRKATPASVCAVGVIMSMAVLGCAGLKLVNSSTNLPVPPSLAQRSLWMDTGIIQYKLEALAGYVIERKDANSSRLTRLMTEHLEL